MQKLMRKLLVGLGLLFLGIGMIGTAVPVLPTVPFLMAAAFCFANGSKRFHNWFSGTKVYKEHLQSFMEQRAMTRRQKFRALGLMTVMILGAMCFISSWQGKLGLLLVILFNYVLFAVGIRTITEEEAQKIKQKGEAANEP